MTKRQTKGGRERTSCNVCDKEHRTEIQYKWTPKRLILGLAWMRFLIVKILCHMQRLVPDHRTSRWKGDGDVAQLVERRTGTLLTQIRLPGAAKRFPPTVNFQCRLSYGVRTPPCAITCINICAQVKDPVVHVRVRWITKTLKHPACTLGWLARFCRSWLSNPNGTIQL